MDDEQDWKIERILLDFARILLDEEGNEQLGKLKEITMNDFSRIAGALKKRTVAFEQSIIALADKASIDHFFESSCNAFYQGRSGYIQYFEKLSKVIWIPLSQTPM